MMCDITEREVIKKDLLCSLRWIRSKKDDHVCIVTRSSYPSGDYKHFIMLVLDKEKKWIRMKVSMHEDVNLRYLFADIMVRFDTRVPIRCQVHKEDRGRVVYHEVDEIDSVETLRLHDPNTMALVFF